MSQLASSSSSECLTRISLSPRVKGLIDAFEIPSPLPDRPAVTEPKLPPSNKTVHGQATILFHLLLLWLRYQFVQRLRPTKMAATAQAIAMRMAQFQGFWFDLAQFLAQRDGFLSLEQRKQFLRQCQPSPALTFAEVEAIVAQDTRFPMAVLFSHFEKTPFRVGKYDDSYRARLRVEDVAVEVKVLRPDLAVRLERDLKVFRLISKIIHWAQGGPKNIFDEVIEIYTARLPSLLDLRYEASAMRRMRSSLREHNVYVAKLFRNFLGKRILIHEHIPAPTLQDFLDLQARDPDAARTWLQANDIDLDRAGRQIYHSLLRQICEDNFFNQNLGPANILLLRESQIGILSCDATTSVNKRFLTIFNLAMSAMARDAYEKFADTLFLLCESLPANDLSNVRSDIIRTVRTHAARSVLKSADHEEKSLYYLTNEISAILYRNGIVLDGQMVKLMIAIGSVDASVSVCCPNMNHRVGMERYAKKAAARRVKQVFADGITKAVVGVVGPLSEMVHFETALMRKKAQTFRASAGKLAYVGATILHWVAQILLMGGAFGFWVYLHQHHYNLLGFFYGISASSLALELQWMPMGTWGLIFIMLIVVYRGVREMARRIEEIDVNNSGAS